MPNHPNRSNPWPTKRDWRYATRAAQAAKLLSVTLGEKEFDPPAVYDAQQWSVEVWRLSSGKLLAISGDKRGFDAKIIDAIDWPCTAYGRKSEQQAIAGRAGIMFQD